MADSQKSITTTQHTTEAVAYAEVMCKDKVDLALSGLVFPSQKSDSYRASIKTSSSGGKGRSNVIIWLESKRTKEQLQCVVKDIKQHAPDGVEIPSSIVLLTLKHALEANTCPRGTNNRGVKQEDSTADLIASLDGDVVLHLKLHLLSSWQAVYKFQMVPLAVEQVDILQAQIRDIFEELEELKISKGCVSQLAALQATVSDLEERVSCLESTCYPLPLPP